LLREIQELTDRQFVYEDGWCGMVPLEGKLNELQTGPPLSFAELTWREQADVLREFIHWNRYPDRSWDDEYRIRENIAAGKPAAHWLEETSLQESFRLLAEGSVPPAPKHSPELTHEDLATIRDAFLVFEGPTEGKICFQNLRQKLHASDRKEPKSREPEREM
jgi:hypothetical protein